jgi:hypothetical protein
MCALRSPTPIPRSGIAWRSRYPIDPARLNAKRQVGLSRRRDLAFSGQYFGAGAAEALHDDLPGAAEALHDDLPLAAGAAFALHEALPPAADGSVAPGVAPFPPPHPIAEPISIPATAETARVFARFIASSSPRLFGFSKSVSLRFVSRRRRAGVGESYAPD